MNKILALLFVVALAAACGPTPASPAEPTASPAAAATAAPPPSPLATPTAAAPEPTAAPATAAPPTSPLATPEAAGPRQVGTVDDALAAQAALAIAALRDRDLAALAGLAHPDKGITFSPYAYVRTSQEDPAEPALVFGREQIPGLWADPTVYHWGSYDGSGLPIDRTFQEYYGEFVYDVDFARPEVIGYGQAIGQGNSINNIAAVWPDALTVEYHFSGFDPQYGGLDWRSLRLVFEQAGGSWALVAIVHDQWTT